MVLCRHEILARNIKNGNKEKENEPKKRKRKRKEKSETKEQQAPARRNLVSEQNKPETSLEVCS